MLRGDEAVADSWDATATLDGTKLELAVEMDALREFQFGQSDWLSRPAWYWFSVRDSDPVRNFAKDLRPDEGFVFCEDVSRFLVREAAREFVSDVASPYVRRFAVDLESPEATEFLDGERGKAKWDDDSTDPSEMDYRPAVRFAL